MAATASSRTPSVSSQGSDTVSAPGPGAAAAGTMRPKDYAVYDARAALDASTRTVGALREELRQQAAAVRGYEAENTALVAELKLVQTQHQTAVDDAAGAEERMAALRFASRESVDRLEDQYRNTGAITDSRVVALEQALAEEKTDGAAAEAMWVDKTAGLCDQLATLEQKNAVLKQALDAADRSYQDELARLNEELAQATSAAAAAAVATATAAAVEGDGAGGGGGDGNVGDGHSGRLAQIETQFVSMQAQYTERIVDLEGQLAATKGKPSINTQHRPFTRVKELEIELINSTAAYKGRIAKLEQQLAATPGRGDGKAKSAATRYVPVEVAAHLDQAWDASGAAEETAELRAEVETASQFQQQQQQQAIELLRQHAELQADHREHIQQLQGERDQALARLQRAGHAELFARADGDPASLRNKIDSLEKVIGHLNDQLSRSPSTEVLASYDAQLRDRDRQIDTLHAQLTLAKKHHSPALLHFDQIEARLIDLEARLRRRDREIETMNDEGRRTTSHEVQECERKWRGVVAAKQAQVEKFRLELDRMLEAIRIMQRNGVQVSFPHLLSPPGLG